MDFFDESTLVCDQLPGSWGLLKSMRGLDSAGRRPVSFKFSNKAVDESAAFFFPTPTRSPHLTWPANGIEFHQRLATPRHHFQPTKKKKNSLAPLAVTTWWSKEAFHFKRKIFGNLRWLVEKLPVHRLRAPPKQRILELEERYAHVVPSPMKMQPRSYVMLHKLIYTSASGYDFGPSSTTNWEF